MKILFQHIWDRREFLATLLTGFILLGMFSIHTAFLAKTSKTFSLSSANDPDASNAIHIASKTNLINDNGWRPYGPVHFRLTHILNSFFKWDFGDKTLSEEEKEEVSSHFFLNLISLLALYLISFTLAAVITDKLYIKFFITLIGSYTLLLNEVWTHHLFKTHPDLLFALFVLLATQKTFKYLDEGEKVNEHFYLSAFYWGIAASTKLSIPLFIPGLMIIFLVPFKKANALKLLKYIGAMLFAYCLVGFPQNFIFWKSIAFLLSQSRYSSLMTFDSIQEFLTQSKAQSQYFIALFLVFIFLFNDKKRQIKVSWKHQVVVIIPFLFILTREVHSLFHHYIIPFVGTFTFLFVQIFRTKIKSPIFKEKNLIIVFTSLLIFSLLNDYIPRSVTHEFHERFLCEKESRFIIQKSQELLKTGKKIIITPYVPLRRSNSKKIGNNIWTYSLEMLQDNYDTFIARRGFYQRYAEDSVSINASNDTTNVDSTRELFLLMHKKESFLDKAGHTWRKTYSDECSFEIWEKQ